MSRTVQYDPSLGFCTIRDMIAGRTDGITDRVKSAFGSLTPSERRVARVLVSNFPIAGLESLVRISTRAGVSTPTTLRFLGKLGFAGYAEFQEALRQEVHVKISAPASRYPSETPRSGTGRLPVMFRALERNLESTLGRVDTSEFDDVARVLSDPRKRILVLGGRVSHVLADHLAGQLRLLRSGVILLGQSGAFRLPEDAVDITRRNVLVVFDFRRYQNSAISFSRLVARRGATIILVTDQWHSPIAKVADRVFSVSIESVPPFDSLIGGFALVDCLVGTVADRLGATGRKRMRFIDVINAGSMWGDTLEAPKDGSSTTLGPSAAQRGR